MKAKPKAKSKAKKPSAATLSKAKAKSIRSQPLMPHLVCAGAAKAIDFYKKAFGASELMRLAGKDGKLMHASVAINGACVMLVDEMREWGALSPKSLKGTPVTVHLNVDDVDAVFKRAVKAGATPIMPVADMFWGDRYGVIEDPFGHRWSIATHLRDMTPKEIEKAMRSAAPM
jgi:PhnB protein